MNLLLPYTVLYAITPKFDPFSSEVQFCDIYKDVTQDYRNAMNEFTVLSLKNAGPKKLSHFVYSPLSAWITLAVIAEGSDPDTKKSMFQLLGLPSNLCTRLKYYQLATSRFNCAPDIYITNKRALVIDERVTINPIYHNFVFQNSLLNIMSAPIRRDPQMALSDIRRVSSAKLPNLDLSGNSVILDTVDYNGLWRTAFENAVLEKSPFYNDEGKQIGTVDLMKVRRHARVAYVKSLNAKALQLPVGLDGRYHILIGIVLDKDVRSSYNGIEKTFAEEFFEALKGSYVPIDIAIPRFNLTSEYDMRKILEEGLDLKDIWTNSTVTEYLSHPAALPSGFVHRATITLDKAGLAPPPLVHISPYNSSTGLDPIVGNNFIANKPFLFGLVDAETYTPIMAGAFTEPTYPS